MAVKIKCLYATALTAPVTTLTITGLNGDTDVMYDLKCRFVCGATTAAGFFLRVNNDTSTSYGYQLLYANSTAVAAERALTQSYDWMYASSVTSGDATHYVGFLYAKSGYPRTMTSQSVDKVSTTTCTTVPFFGQVWNNTADNVTSLVVLSDKTNGLGTGTVIELYTRTTV